MGKTIRYYPMNRSHKLLSKQTTLKLKEKEFIHQLSSSDPQTTSQVALHHLHLFIKNNKTINLDLFQKKTQQILRFCKVCDKFNHLRSIKTCYQCEDHYHKSCYGKEMELVDGKFVCDSCLANKSWSRKCSVCHKTMAQNGVRKSCQFCLNEYHSNCMASENRCKRCERMRLEMKLEKRSKKIRKKVEEERIKSTNRNLRDMFVRASQKDEMIVQNSQIMASRKICAFKALTVLDKNSRHTKKYENRLQKVIEGRQMNYTEDLKDVEFHLQKMKEGNMNFGLQNMSELEELQYLSYKNQPIGPFSFQFSKKKGYGVIADMDIPRKSIICQYVGQVVTLRQCQLLDQEQGKNDSQMDLWIGRHSDQKLVIRPSKWTNIARFINGVKDFRSSPNIVSIRLCFRGLPVILLIANRDIKKGESLSYDYNAGGIAAKYDTSHFVE